MTSRKVVPPFNPFAMAVLRQHERETANLTIRRSSTLAGFLGSQKRESPARTDRNGSQADVTIGPQPATTGHF